MAFSIAVATLASDFIGAKYFELKKETIIDLAPYLIWHYWSQALLLFNGL